MKPKLFTTISDYSWGLCPNDALAGVTVALVALPLSIAIAFASSAEPGAGLVTAIIGGFLISLLGGRRSRLEALQVHSSRSALFFATMVLTIVSNLTIAIGVGTFAGLAMRLLHKEREPKKWSPADRSTL